MEGGFIIKMNSITIIVLALCMCATVAQDTKKYDNASNVNIEAILSNDRIVTNYIKCLLETGSCTKEGRDLRRLLPDAIQTDCSRCTADQKRNSRKVITFLRTRRPQDWKKLTDKYDPQGLFKKRSSLA
ncbi:Ejaculatory bulb-specific protein 3, partial [Pseudolycoriella hygida]